MNDSTQHLLLMWASKNHGLPVTLRSIQALYDLHTIQLAAVHLFFDSAPDDVQQAELDIYKQVAKKKQVQLTEKQQERLKECRELAYQLDRKQLKPLLSTLKMPIQSVTDYQSIYNVLREYLRNNEFKNTVLHINVSPGTPQMHTVWLMLNASGYLPSRTRLWSSQHNPKENSYEFNEITFKPNTYLNEAFESAYQQQFVTQINPNDTVSPLRKKAEEDLILFTSVSNQPILLLGERGVGKTTYVEQFIKNKYYKNKPFESLPCGIFTEELMRSELFGHEKGAFTGAEKAKKGIFQKFEQGGLLFLDEIHDLSLPLQRQLMQVLQSGEYWPIGSDRPRKTHFRLVTASNLTFSELCERLSLDFLDRIACFIVEIPALKHSRADLNGYWVRTWNSLQSDFPLPQDKTLQQFFETFSFNGNFRDLQRLASYIEAFLKKKLPLQEAIQQAIALVERWQSSAKQLEKNSYFVPDASYDQMVSSFNRDLADWAIAYYGNRSMAQDKLEKSAGWLSNALNGKSRKKA